MIRIYLKTIKTKSSEANPSQAKPIQNKIIDLIREILRGRDQYVSVMSLQ